jgi:hypothetical protein
MMEPLLRFCRSANTRASAIFADQISVTWVWLRIGATAGDRHMALDNLTKGSSGQALHRQSDVRSARDGGTYDGAIVPVILQP